MVDKSEKFSWLVRVGYFARAILYIMLGVIALTSAGRISEGAQGVFRAVEEFPGGTVVLWVLVVGLFGYALFRFASTFFDIENHGSDKKGIAQRVGHAASGVGHLLLAWSAFKFATSEGSGSGGGGSDGGQAQSAAAGVLSFELGSIVLGLVGVAFIVSGLFQAKKGISGQFMNRISPRAPDATRWLGGAGYCARAVVFVVIGWSLMQAAWFSSTAEVVTIGGAVASLGEDGIIFTLVAIGLLLFGLFSLVLARYRVVPEMTGQGVPSFRA